MTRKYGYWEVGDRRYFNKYEGFLESSNTKKPITFNYHNDIWEQFDRTKLGKIPLNYLYKERALQLRDRYSYLILNYSGGADSHNILRTFLDNNIRLDELCIKWPKPLIDGKFYKANTFDTTAYNRWSEWDFAILPTLNYLRSYYPQIKISIKDFIGDVDSIETKGLLDKVNHYRNAGILATVAVSDSDLQYKTVGHIYGVDKPFLSFNHQTNMIGMFFTDQGLDMVYPGSNQENAECFYWSYDFPILPFEMAFTIAKVFRQDKNLLKYLFLYDMSISNTICQKIQHQLTLMHCYTTWDYRFQTGKMYYIDARDKYSWFFTCNEFNTVRSNIENEIMERLSVLDNNLLLARNTMKTLATKAFDLLKV